MSTIPDMTAKPLGLPPFDNLLCAIGLAQLGKRAAAEELLPWIDAEFAGLRQDEPLSGDPGFLEDRWPGTRLLVQLLRKDIGRLLG